MIFSYLTERITAAKKRVMVLAHRDELLEQIHASLQNFRVLSSIVSGGMGYDRRYPAHVASVFTIARRLDKIEVPDYLIIDEAHHVTPNTVWGRVIAALRARNPAMRLLGVTATPCRLSGEGLGETFGEMVLGPTPAELIDAGWLSKYRMFGPPPGEQVDMSRARTVAGDYRHSDVVEAVDRPVIHGSAIAHYRKHCSGVSAIAFCPSIEAAVHNAEAFRAAGYSAAHIDGKMDRLTRKNVVRDFAAGTLQVMTSCALVSEGFDVPAVGAAILLNPTQSTAKCLQEYGRALRPSPGKEYAIILDHAGNSSRHGLPDDDREWSLAGVKKRKKSDAEDDVSVKQCPMCYTCCKPAAMACPNPECNHKFVAVARKIAQVEGELSEIDIERQRRERRIEQGSAQSFDDLVAVGVARKMKNPAGWARHVLLARQEKEQKKLAAQAAAEAAEREAAEHGQEALDYI